MNRLPFLLCATGGVAILTLICLSHWNWGLPTVLIKKSEYFPNQVELLPINIKPLSQDVINGIEKYVFFIGYRHSGHSFVGSIMDAHPNMIVAHEFQLFNKLSSPEEHDTLLNKTYLFNELYRKSLMDATLKDGWRNDAKAYKGYTLGVKSQWQAGFTQLKVIGDKGGGRTSDLYYQNPREMQRLYREFLDTVQVPLRVVHVIRNPYDVIATDVLYNAFGEGNGSKMKSCKSNQYHPSPSNLMFCVNRILAETATVEHIIKDLELTVLHVHIEEFIQDPWASVQRICDFLDVECTREYLQACSEKSYTAASRTRDSIVWTPEAIAMVRGGINQFTALGGYSFEDI